MSRGRLELSDVSDVIAALPSRADSEIPASWLVPRDAGIACRVPRAMLLVARAHLRTIDLAVEPEEAIAFLLLTIGALELARLATAKRRRERKRAT